MFKPKIPETIQVNVKIDLADDAKRLLLSILSKVNIMAEELRRLEQEVKENSDVIDSAVTLIEGIKAALDAAIASGDPRKLTELSNTLDAKSNRLAQAVAANTPSSGGGGTPPTEPPEPETVP